MYDKEFHVVDIQSTEQLPMNVIVQKVTLVLICFVLFLPYARSF